MHSILINCPFAYLLYPAMPCLLSKSKETLSISWLMEKNYLKIPETPMLFTYFIWSVSEPLNKNNNVCIDSFPILYFCLFSHVVAICNFVQHLYLTSVFHCYPLALVGYFSPSHMFQKATLTVPSIAQTKEVFSDTWESFPNNTLSSGQKAWNH